MVYLNFITLTLMALPVLSFIGSIIFTIVVTSINYVEDNKHYEYDRRKFIFKLFIPTIYKNNFIHNGPDLVVNSFLSNCLLALLLCVWPIFVIVGIVLILLKTARAIRRLQKNVEKLRSTKKE